MRLPEVVTATEGDEIGSVAWDNEEIGIASKCSKEESVSPPKVITAT